MDIHDMHVHTKYSCDSDAELEAYCPEAIKRGVKTVCFTDHVDYNVFDHGYGYYKADGVLKDFAHIKEKYRGEPDFLCGVEFSEPHLYQDKLKEYSDLPYDYILGSVHYWHENMFPTEMIKAKIPVEICYEKYWDEILSAVKNGGFDVLAHIDFPKRYYKQLIFDPEKIREICNIMIQNNICLEINTSSLRKDLAESMPDKEILSIYKACGGKYITVGSDAHKADELAADYHYAKGLIDFFGFEEIIFHQRERIGVKNLN